MSALKKEKIVAGMRQLPALPGIVQELLASFAQEDVDVGRIARQIAQDVALSSRVLRVANSSFYGLQSRVSTIQEAVVVLGFRAVRSLVLAVSMSTALQVGRCPAFDLQAYRRHSIAVSMAAMALAPLAGCNRDLAFTAGLLHDIGQLALAANFPDDYSRVIDYQVRHDCFITVAERDLLSIDHAEVGGLLAETWHFPAVLRQALAEHHAPAAATADSLANLIHIADITAHALGLSQSAQEVVMPIDRTAWLRIGGDWQAFSRLLPEIEQGFEEAIQVLV